VIEQPTQSRQSATRLDDATITGENALQDLWILPFASIGQTPTMAPVKPTAATFSLFALATVNTLRIARAALVHASSIERSAEPGRG
jgi:hypothetical protein